ncbi:DUF2167 domain-containing protein [Massilia sp. IC2-477]|uniref:DUF2167 domain-containing protein n=1 Tax=Massilia sp. IC2-477 TaxID=2887198 RepID=UPI001D12CCA2|nr:DUF2167 domain-containing protein [Massilia sp. IC2-477]MCC2957194.1 DUF2167 domain-containing protein [Massilia sp. IC2-477]
MQRFLIAILLCLSLGAAGAQDAAPAQRTAEQFLASLSFQQGRITLPGGIATLDLPPAFRYLAPGDSARLLEQGWGNPPGAGTLGMIVPAGVSPLSEQGWGVVITYEKDGHVKDDDADSIDYDELLTEIKDGIAEGNKERKEQGYPAMTLVGWAEKPHYDKGQHKLYWAKELRTEGAQANGLNYNIRVLGREGVLVLNAVASLSQLDQIRTEMQQVTAFTNFNAGHRYADFNASTDKVAEYGIAALVAGGVAAKLGFFGKLLALLVAFKKLIILGVAALASVLWKFLRREKPAPGLRKVDLSKGPEA